MQCKDVRELLNDYTDGKTDSALNVVINNHIDSCDSCREHANALSRVWNELEQMPETEAPLHLHARIMERIDAERQQRRTVYPIFRFKGFNIFSPKNLAIAATILILAMAGIGYEGAQQAGLGPAGLLYPWMHSQNHKSTVSAKAFWLPSDLGNQGHLVIILQSNPNSSSHSLYYNVSLQPLHPEEHPLAVQYRITRAGIQKSPVHISIPLSSKPTGIQCRLTLTYHINNSSSTTQDIPLPQ